MEVNCVRCNTKLVIDDSMQGQDVRCPKCEFVFVANPAVKTASGTGGEHVSVTDVEPTDSEPVIPNDPSPECWFLRIPEGNEFGPVDRATLDNWVREGRISHDCELRDAGTDVWNAATVEYPVLQEGNPFASTADPHLKRLKPHRGTLVLGLSIAGCFVPFLSIDSGNDWDTRLARDVCQSNGSRRRGYYASGTSDLDGGVHDLDWCIRHCPIGNADPTDRTFLMRRELKWDASQPTFRCGCLRASASSLNTASPCETPQPLPVVLQILRGLASHDSQ